MAAVEAMAMGSSIGPVDAEEEIRSRVSEGPEEGEIVGDEAVVVESSEHLKSSAAAAVAAAPQTHPLEYSWTFWFDNPSAKAKQADWGNSISAIYTLATVEEFWSVYNHIHKPSKLATGAGLHLFKYKIQPKWEDPICANGGRWTISVPRGKADTYWLYTLLAMIGEQFDSGEEICGAVIDVKTKLEKIAIWTKNASNEAAQLSIGRQWKEFLDYNDTIGFVVHEDAKKHGRSTSAKNRYSI
ncbi:hypothetical protein Syun_009090 [Stephania yunnanensis]|uniref:eIF-4F 25 kDa subunit n=1 Tax=Stephania yunnanensis TaxID=152371 RepID=A0AAP0KDT5_9MAGN